VASVPLLSQAAVLRMLLWLQMRVTVVKVQLL
jgi:hypothetical protein